MTHKIFFIQKTSNWKYFIIILVSIVSATALKYTNIVETKSGPVRGKILKTAEKSLEYSAFKGIPYGEPPVGPLRFQSPVKKAKWTNVLDAIKDGKTCMQWSFYASKVQGSEDCLNLNVYTPHLKFDKFKDTDLKAVMVWIYGGAFIAGSATQAIYGPDYLIEHDVILVAMNYRLGILGFLNLNHEHSSSNVGLKDQNLAMKWVKENIASFGGNPNKITIFGQSAGGASVDYQVLSEKSAGLFDQSISMSATPLCYYWAAQTQIEAVHRTFAIGAELGIKTKNKEELVKRLRTVDAESIVKAQNTIKTALRTYKPIVENATISKDDAFLTKCAVDKYITGEYNKKPHMMGYTSCEAKGYFSAFGKITTSEMTKLQPLLEYVSAMKFEVGIEVKRRLMLNHDHKIFYYNFSFDPQPGSLGAGHADDLRYLFYTEYKFLRPNFDNPDIKLTQQRYLRLFTNFAKFGHPTPDGNNDSVINIHWSDSRPNGNQLIVDKDLQVVEHRASKLEKNLMSIGSGFLRIMLDCE